MKTIAMVKEVYRSADFETRLYLFLDCPELRKDFMEIEQAADAAVAHETKQPDAIDKIGSMMDSLLKLFPLSLQTKLKRICCG